MFQNIAERCQEYFQYFIAIEIMSKIFVKYCKLFHRNITILTLHTLYLKRSPQDCCLHLSNIIKNFQHIW